MPGDLFGFADVHPEVESALLVHELEHLNCLMYPLGPVLTSLALRANDLGNDAAKAYKRFMEVALRTEYGSAELDGVGLDVVRAAATLADHATVTLSTLILLRYTKRTPLGSSRMRVTSAKKQTPFSFTQTVLACKVSAPGRMFKATLALWRWSSRVKG